MAFERESLAQFQTRLAQRLQQASNAHSAAHWLAVRCGSINYLLPLGQVGDVFSAPVPQVVPHTRLWFGGVINSRGKILGVIDFQAFVQELQLLGEISPSPSSRSSQMEWLMVAFNPVLEFNCALRIDAVWGLKSLADFESSAQYLDTEQAVFKTRWVDDKAGIWQEVDLEALAETDVFLNIGVKKEASAHANA